MTITLSEFIADVGDAKAAKLFGVKERTAKSWRRRERKPRPDQVPMIIEKSCGKLSYESIYSDAQQATARRAVAR